MFCPFCTAQDTKVTDSRLVSEGHKVKRRRECLTCKERFTTFEAAELNFPRIIKRDGSRVSFDPEKLRAGMIKALEKRPVDAMRIEQAMTRLLQQLQALGEDEVSSKQVGQLVMDELRALDQVAYVRFASVYRCFQDVKAFQEEIQRLLAEMSLHETE